MIIRKIRRYRYIPIHLVHRYPAHIFLPQATCSRQPEQQWQTAASTVPHDIRARPVCQFFLKTAERRLLFLIPILHQTTTGYFAWRYVERLFLIPILHQTTTIDKIKSVRSALFLIPILHQTTTALVISESVNLLFLIPILHQTTTVKSGMRTPVWLFLIPILHQTTTLWAEK